MDEIAIIHNANTAGLHPNQPHATDPSISFERQERLAGLIAAARSAAMPRVVATFEAPLATPIELELVHTPSYLSSFARRCDEAGTALLGFGSEFDVGQHSFVVASCAVGGALEGIRMVMRGEVRHVLSICRPPGHHAEPDHAMGFCGLSIAAVAGCFATQHRSTSGEPVRVTIFDYDAHSGNGTIKGVQSNLQIQFCEVRTMTMDASHTSVTRRAYPYPDEYPYLPSNERRVLEDMYLGCTGREYIERVRKKILPAIRAFAPHILIISAGFDCMIGDPLGDLGLSGNDIEILISDLAAIGCPTLTVIEGGYDLENIATGMAAHVRGLLRRAE